MLKGVYRIMARWYSGADNTNESYVLTSDNSFKDTNLEVGRKVHTVFSESGNYPFELIIDSAHSLLKDISKLQSIGMDGRKFLVIGNDNDLEKLQEEVKTVLELIDAFDNDSDHENDKHKALEKLREITHKILEEDLKSIIDKRVTANRSWVPYYYLFNGEREDVK